MASLKFTSVFSQNYNAQLCYFTFKALGIPAIYPIKTAFVLRKVFV